MNLKEAKSQALKLVDEYSNSGYIAVDNDIEMRLNSLFDLAQKNLANIAPIRRLLSVTQRGYVPFESNVTAYLGAFAQSQAIDLVCMGAGVWIDENDTRDISLDCLVMPQTITDDTPDSYEFEICESGALAMPYWVAAQLLATDLVCSYSPLLALYDRAVANVRSMAFSRHARVVI